MMTPLLAPLPACASTPRVNAPPSNGSVVVPFLFPVGWFFFPVPPLDAHENRAERARPFSGALCRRGLGFNPASLFRFPFPL
jgi:hypothetical protein